MATTPNLLGPDANDGRLSLDVSIHKVKNPLDDEYLGPSILGTDDDLTLNPWTLRTWVLGLTLSALSASLSSIGYFKPQSVNISTIFLSLASFILGKSLLLISSRFRCLGSLLSSQNFNSKEHVAIVIMASSAASFSLGTEALAVQKLYYDLSPHPAVAILFQASSQLIGFSLSGLLREVLVYPAKMLYPKNLPVNSLVETLHGGTAKARHQLRLFSLVFSIIMAWEVFPEYIMPLATGMSVMCLSSQGSPVVTHLFGGSNPNEGLGLLSISLDWNYIAAYDSPLWVPLATVCNSLAGYLIGIAVLMSIYYGNIWRAFSFPFLSQALFSENSSETKYSVYNQTALLGSDHVVNQTALESLGAPYVSASNAVNLLTSNLCIGATFTHLLLWNREDITPGWLGFFVTSLQQSIPQGYCGMLDRMRPAASRNSSNDDKRADDFFAIPKRDDVKSIWLALLFLLCFGGSLACLYLMQSTLPWWGFLIACGLGAICTLFLVAQYAITGFLPSVAPLAHLLAGYLHPGKPLANLFFTVYGHNVVHQAAFFLRDLKLAQYAHLAPKCAFVMQVVGTLVGAVINYVFMVIIVDRERDVLLSIQGSDFWSGQGVQSFNSQAVAWGGLAQRMFSLGARYQWIPLAFFVGLIAPIPFYLAHRRFPELGLKHVNTAIIGYHVGGSTAGVNSGTTSFFALSFLCQGYLRRYRSQWFLRYNYILSAALDGGTQIMVFILTFAVHGGGGMVIPFPKYWGNNRGGNYDYCEKT